jgi:2'-deoxynucleoside 5'-phosphate N-hydrolase
MNIYFACSITGGREFEAVYQVIVAALEADGHEIPTSHLASSEVVLMEKIVSPAEVFTRDIEWIRAADVLVAEVSVPSHGVGYEIGYALGLGKPVLACHRQDRAVSKMISGNPDPNLTVQGYETAEQAGQVVRTYLSYKFRQL